MGLTKISTDGVKDDAVTTDKLANAINTERTANTAKVSTTINNNADNRVITGSGTANTLEGESKFTFDGSLVTTEKRMVIGNGTDFQIPSRNSTSSYTPQFQVTGAWNDPTHGGTMALNGRNDYPLLWLNSGASFSDNSGAGYIVWSIKDGAGNYCNTASIESQIDGTPGNNDSPGMLRFLTTPDGTCSPTERMRIDSSGNCGIGDNSPQARLHIQGENSTNGTLYLEPDSNKGNNISHIHHGSAGNWYIRPADASGYIYHDIGKSQFTNGILFGSDTAAANTLDDYEEGTWTPTITTQYGSWTSISYMEQHGFYIKVGRKVTVWVRIRVSSINVTGASGYLYLNGLPYTVATTSSPNTSSDGGTLSINYYSNLQNLSNKVPTGYSWSNTNSFFMMLVGEAGSASAAPADMFNSANSQIYGCCTYFTA